MGVQACETELLAAAVAFSACPEDANYEAAERLKRAACNYASAKRHNHRSRDRWKARKNGLPYDHHIHPDESTPLESKK